MSPIATKAFLTLGLLLALCARASAAESCDAVDQLITTTSAPPQSRAGWELYSKQSGLAGQAPAVDTVVVGDSLAELFDAQYWLPSKAFNLGVGGDRTQHVLWRLNSFDWSVVSTKKILLLLGTNNLGGDKPCAITAGLISIFERLTRIWPTAKVSYLEIPPRGTDFRQFEEQRLSVNEAMRKVRGLTAFNLDDRLTCGGTTPCKNYRADLVHFSSDGYATILKGYYASLLMASAPAD